MNSVTLSPQARIAALVLVLLVALGGSAFFLLHGHSQPQTVTTPAPPVQHPVQHPTPTPTHHHPVQPTVDPLLPTPLRTALMQNPIVVVGFYDPHSHVSRRTITEARAGAATADVGFLAVNLLNDAVAGRLTALLPSGQMLPSPGIAIYARPGTIVYRTDGFIERMAVVQAVMGTR